MNAVSLKWLALPALALLAAGCGRDAAKPPADGAANAAQAGDKTIAQTLAGSPDHSTLLGAVKAAGLEKTFAGSDPYTVFAPNNAAFAKLPAGAAERLMMPEAKGELTSVLTYHVVPGVVTAPDLGRAIEQGGGKAELATVGGGSLTATRDGDAIVITDAAGGKARVVQADMAQSNGVVHVIDAVLMSGSGGRPPS